MLYQFHAPNQAEKVFSEEFLAVEHVFSLPRGKNRESLCKKDLKSFLMKLLVT